MSDRPYMTEREVAQRYGLTIRTLQKWRRLNKGPAYFKLGGSVRYRPEDIETFERAQRIEP